MKKTIFTTISLVALIALMSFTKTATTPKDDGKEKHYTFCYAVEEFSNRKVIYVSDVLYCYFSDESYKATTYTGKNYQKSQLDLKWSKKVRTYTDSNFDTEVMYWANSFNEVDGDRDEVIARYKNVGYRVEYIEKFYFECD